MIHVAYRLAFVVALGVSLCWCAIQEQKIRELEFRMESVESSCVTQNDVNRYIYRDITAMGNAHNSACVMIEVICGKVDIEVHRDE